jgi:WD40 repeat protein
MNASGREMLSVTFDRDAGVVFAAGMFPEVAVLDPTDGTAGDSIPLPLSGFGSLDVSPDGRLLAAGSRSGVVLVYAIANKSEPLFRINQPDTQVTGLAFSPDRETLAVAYSSKRVAMVKIADQQTDQVLRFDSVPQSLAYSETGALLVVGTQSGQLHFVDLVGGTTQSIDAHQGRINAIGFFPGCRRLVSGGRDKKINLWDVESRQRVAVLHGHQRQIFGIDISPDGQALASVGLDGDLRLWRIQTQPSASTAKDPSSQP